MGSFDSMDGANAGQELMDWLEGQGAGPQLADVREVIPPNGVAPLHLAVARPRPGAPAISAGDTILKVPEHLVITLDRIFESEFVAELLTTDKLSELSCLTLYLMYEKKLGRTSFWRPFIRELDRQRARAATTAVESPLLWGDEDLDALLQGSPLLPAVRQRLAGIRREYEALDTVWFMSKSIFSKYPYDLPTEAFTFERFKQAFAAVQASTVHLQGVPLARRFALVPLGPPLVSYSSTCKAMFAYDAASRCVTLAADRDYAPGEPLFAWCGPQPNSRMLLNYSVVDENNPHDKLQLTATIPSSDPLFLEKRAVLTRNGLASQQTFDLQRGRALPPLLLPFLRLATATSSADVQRVALAEGAAPLSAASEAALLAYTAGYLVQRLAAYPRPLHADLETQSSPNASPRQKIAARLTKIEKGILTASLEEVRSRLGAPLSDGEALAALAACPVKLS